ncbi:MAG: reductive dehalogenase [Dehalogenimonas sp.]
MSKFHSIVSRRDFMKGLGLAGVGAAALTAPAFHDLDEVTSSDSASWKRAWWVKKQDEPSVELDWSQIKRYDHRLMAHSSYPHVQHIGKEKWLEAVAQGPIKTKERLGTPGWDIRSTALSGSQGVWTSDQMTRNDKMVGSDNGFKTPEQQGLPKWTGTPEEANRMMRAVVLAYGANQLGVTHMGTGGDKHRNLIYTYSRTGPIGASTGDEWIDKWPPPPGYWRKIEMRDVAVGFEEPLDGVKDVVQVLPNADLWDMGIMIAMPREAWRVGNGVNSGSQISSWGNGMRYNIYHTSVQPGVKRFLRAIGYHAYGYSFPEFYGGLMPSEASGVMGGVAECARSSEIIINPEVGPTGGYFSILTDLPMSVDKPIDAGIFRFCHSCHKCADYCPSGSISKDTEPDWEIPWQRWGYKVPSLTNNPGKKLFWSDMTTCRISYGYINACNQLCRGVCSFNVNNSAMIHELVHATASTTGIFNRFFYSMSKSFGYGPLDPDDWWAMADGLPARGTDSTAVSFSGGYKK